MFYLVCKNSDNPGMSWIHQSRTEKSLIFTPKSGLSFPIFSYAGSGSKSGSEPTSFIEPLPSMTVTFAFIHLQEKRRKADKTPKKAKTIFFIFSSLLCFFYIVWYIKIQPSSCFGFTCECTNFSSCKSRRINPIVL